MNAAVVIGNGPLSDDDRGEIQRMAAQGATVYRFNDFWNKNYQKDEPVDVHVKKLGSLWAPRHQRHFPDGKDHPKMKSKLVVNYTRPVFHGCSSQSGGKVKSTGTNMLSRLERDKKVETIDVFGMNWNFTDNVHSVNEGHLIEACCSKCTIHPTPTQDYLPTTENVVVSA